MSAAPWFPPVALLALVVWSGGGALALLPRSGSRGHRLVIDGMAGSLLLLLAHLALDVAGIRWSSPLILVPLVLLGLGRVLRRSQTATTTRLGWGDALAGVVVIGFAGLAVSLWITSPDFVYHWGLKGARFFAFGEVDYDYLRSPWRLGIHAGYPLLLPVLYAATATLGGDFAPAPQMLWSVAAFAATLVALRDGVQDPRLAAADRQRLLGALALAAGTLGIASTSVGGADWLLALALAAATPALLRPAGAASDVEIGIAAAFAAASKIEGYTLGALLVAVHLLRRRADWRQLGLWLATLAPPLVVGGVWLALVARHGLSQPFLGGWPTLERIAVALAALREAAAAPDLHGLLAGLLLVPALLTQRPVRGLAVVIAGQLACYLLTYVASPMDTRFFVLASFARLAVHLLPSTLAAAGIVLLAAAEGPPADAGSPSSG